VSNENFKISIRLIFRRFISWYSRSNRYGFRHIVFLYYCDRTCRCSL